VTSAFCTLLGAALLLLAAIEIYFTILHGRGRSGPLSEAINRGTWAMLRALALRLARGRRHRVLNMLGPLLLPALIALLVAVLIAGFALIYFPRMPGAFSMNSAPAPRWLDALYFSGVTLLTLGYGDIVPRTGAMRLLALCEAAAGLGVISLAVTYLLSVYGALERKRVVALSFYHQAEEGADVAGFVAHYFVGGEFRGLTNPLNTAARDLQSLLEAHLEHPILHYFHPVEVHKSLPRMLFLALEICAVMRACLDPRAHAGTADHPDRHTLESSARYVLGALLSALRLDPGDRRHTELRDIEQRRWRARFDRTLQRFRESGIQTPSDLTAAWESYRYERDEWAPKLQLLATYLGYEWEEITGDRDLAHAAQEAGDAQPG